VAGSKLFKALGGIFAFLAATLGVVALFVERASLMSHWYVLAIHYIYLYLIILLAWFHFETKGSATLSLPRVILIYENGILLVEGKDWLGTGVAVAVYVMTNDFEQLICSGEVINVQRNGLVQIQTTDPVTDDWEETLKRSKNSLLIRPGIRR
jgi:hypothetical protein